MCEEELVENAVIQIFDLSYSADIGSDCPSLQRVFRIQRLFITGFKNPVLGSQITQSQTNDVPSTSCWTNCNDPEMTRFQRFGLWDEVGMPQCPLLASKSCA
jgi:hypothetical protein